MLVDDEPMFVGKDVAEALGYKRTADAIREHVDDDDKGVSNLPTPGGTQQTTVINESGMYSLVLSSKLPTAKEFKHWVTHEVLPTIRKHGAYMTPDTIKQTLADPDFIIGLATQLKEEQAKTAALAADNEAMRPKAIFADAVSVSHTTILIGELAKLLRQNGVNIGQNRLFGWLRENGYLINRKGTDWNQPTQRSADMKLFKVKETAINHSDGSVSISKTVKVTGKGQQYFINKLLEA
ncbi:phage antirepressor [Lacticaseibacillus sharpeae]|uniref:Prophage antirepressor n=1 Tax=Lacticaseibacillus sharpeae JCM 1186 = DSM 20505 TaxID=1291052 RepID=A0A0R1ZIN5_9LACO|nr:phage antirepressor [Lacticaseibacillus sharpeae]KRM54782.1 prophage antirepressor [Lacticaseibacillus sharpeae JCM 1186 = DSM 20505]